MPDLRIELGITNNPETGTISYSVTYYIDNRGWYSSNRHDLEQIATDILSVTAMRKIRAPIFVIEFQSHKDSPSNPLPADAISTLTSLLYDPERIAAAYAAMPDAPAASPTLSDFC